MRLWMRSWSFSTLQVLILAAGDAVEDQHGLAGILAHQMKELPSLLLVQIYLELSDPLVRRQLVVLVVAEDDGWSLNLASTTANKNW